MKKRTGGTAFKPDEGPVYFMAGYNSSGRGRGVARCQHTLMALNDLMEKGGLTTDQLVERIEANESVFLDSGIFWLTNRHARAHDIPMDEALRLHPEQIDGFQLLWDAYIKTVKKYPGLWGYVELDQGGAERKRETRALIEAEGLVPIPVYHPLLDGAEYFDELCEQYDRICVGNVVQADKDTRRRLLAMMWEQHRRHPDVWLHVLGLTPSELLIAYPFNSADSSTLVGSLRWGADCAPFGMTAMRRFGRPDHEYSYDPDPDNQYAYAKAAELVYTSAHFITHTWRAQHEANLALSPACGLPAVEAWEAPLR